MSKKPSKQFQGCTPSLDKGALHGQRVHLGASWGHKRSHSDPRPRAPAQEPGSRPASPAPSPEQRGTGLKPGPSCDLGRVPGRRPQFPGPNESKAGGLAGGAGSTASWRACVAGRTSGRPPWLLWGPWGVSRRHDWPPPQSRHGLRPGSAPTRPPSQPRPLARRSAPTRPASGPNLDSILCLAPSRLAPASIRPWPPARPRLPASTPGLASPRP